MAVFILIVLAYGAGSIPFGKLVGRLHGIDIQQTGSGNIGFANVLRTLGWKSGIVVLFGDIAKGYLPVLLASHYVSETQLLAVAVAAIAGHLFPVWLKFRGGKGIATGLGATLALDPLLGFLAIGCYLLAFTAFRKSGPSSVTAAWCLPALCMAVNKELFWFYVLLALGATWTHRSNIKSLIAASHV